MGWKAFTIFATNKPGYFGTQPTHDAERAEHIRHQLGLSDYGRCGSSTFESAMYPSNASLHIGAFPHGVIICEFDLPGCFFDARSLKTVQKKGIDFRKFKSGLMNLYPNGEILIIMLHSVVNLWGYCLFTDRRLIRLVAGATDDGIMVNQGEQLPEEDRLLDVHPVEEINQEGYGEELVFDVAVRMLGKRIDEIDEFNLLLSEYKKNQDIPTSIFRKLFGRR